MASLNWFRPPAGDDPGTLNACYEALDIHVVRGRADDVAATVDGKDRTFAWLLTEVAACAGVLRAFGVGLGDRVALGRLSPETEVVVPLAVARIGALASYDDPAGPESTAEAKVTVDSSGFAVDGDEVSWDIAMRAGRTDPGGCADVPGHAVMAVHRDDVLTVLEAVGAPGHTATAPQGGALVEVGGVRFWSLGTP